jgi:hypothetical protein
VEDEMPLAEDFGLHLLELNPVGSMVVFSRISLFHLGWSGDDLYCSTVNIDVGGTHAITLDFDANTVGAVLGLLPVASYDTLRRKFAQRFQEPEFIEFSAPLSIGVRARLAERVENTNETYCPFKVQEVMDASDVVTFSVVPGSVPAATSRKPARPRRRPR